MCAHRLITADIGTRTSDPHQPRGLVATDMLVARSVLHSLAPNWTLDTHQDVEDGALMLMLTPPGAEDTTPTFVLSRHTDGVQVTTVLGDSCDTVAIVSTTRRAVRTALSLHHRGMGLIEKETKSAGRG